MRDTRLLPTLALTALLTTAGCKKDDHARPEVLHQPALHTFEDGPGSALPAQWSTAETNGRGTPGRWLVGQEADGGRSARLAATENSDNTFNIAFAPGTYPADLAIDVKVRADQGFEDQGGGVCWRAGAPGGNAAENYYVVRWNPLERNVRAYHVTDSQRRMVANANVDADPRAWHALRVEHVGSALRIDFGGKRVIDVRDETLMGPGRVGLWTKADAATSFDDLRITPIGG